MKVTDLVALHPACKHYNRVRVPRTRLVKAIKKHDNLLKNIVKRLDEVHGFFCCKERVVDAELGKWDSIVGRIDAICFRVKDGQVERFIVVEVKGYRACGLCEKIQLALYIIALAIKLNTTRLSGLLICNDRIEVLTFNDILKPELYEELSKIISILIV